MSQDNEVCLEWLAYALRRLHAEGQTKVGGYLEEEVFEEVVFETNVAPGS